MWVCDIYMNLLMTGQYSLNQNKSKATAETNIIKQIAPDSWRPQFVFQCFFLNYKNHYLGKRLDIAKKLGCQSLKCR